MFKKIAMSLLVFATIFPLAMAGIHPVVDLEGNVDGSKCLECHEEKPQGNVVHSAIKSGCFACHEVLVNNDVTRVKLKKATRAKLCIQCHSDKDASSIEGRIHSPAIRECLKCHDPHSSDNRSHMLKSVSDNGKDDSICLTCHSLSAGDQKGGSLHAALDQGCVVCHSVHKTGERGKREFDFQLKMDAPALCLDCHDAKDAGLVEAHQGQPIATADCLGCHDPHQSARPKLKLMFVHEPYETGEDGCVTCHLPPLEGKVVLKTASAKELCLTCHEQEAKQILREKVQHPGAASDCTQCHNSHASNSPGLPKPDAVNACLRCHNERAKESNKKHLHQPAFVQGCPTCHEPHGGENSHLLRAKTVNGLCLECHGPDSNPVPVEDTHIVTIFNGRVKLPERYFSMVPRIAIKYGLGHPIERHPVVDQMDQEDATKVRSAINCGSCHQPHASEERNLLVKDQANNLMFCAGCHKEMVM